ncbi:hypothetical protein LTR28_000552, partial [Elasticomyces elasticus]
PVPWSDAQLRAFFDNAAGDIRDLLVVVHDKSGAVEPVKPDHPLLRDLWTEERVVVGRLGRELDGLLGGVLEGRRRGGAEGVGRGSREGVEGPKGLV